MDEIWRPIKEFEETYIISNKARVYSLPRTIVVRNLDWSYEKFYRGRMMRPINDIEMPGSKYVLLQTNGERQLRNVFELRNEHFKPHEIDFDITPQQLDKGWPVPEMLQIDFVDEPLDVVVRRSDAPNP